MARGYTPPTPFREWLHRVLTPNAWTMMVRYDPEWDHYVRMGITLGMVGPVYFSGDPNPSWLSDGRVKIGPHDIWVGNYPYHYGSKMTAMGSTERRPSIGTIRLLRKEQCRVMREVREGLK
jgi:hypothetical protein